MEVEALEAVYSEDCVILDSYPPHLHLHIKPRTAEISSQQVFFSPQFVLRNRELSENSRIYAMRLSDLAIIHISNSILRSRKI